MVRTDFCRISETNFVLEMENGSSINHICVSLSGSEPLPEGSAASIHICFPPKEHWNRVGFISNQKPSAIFRINSDPNTQNNSSNNFNPTGFHNQFGRSDWIRIGISLEPLDIALQHQSSLDPLQPIALSANMQDVDSSVPAVEAQAVTKRLMDHFHNYLSSFNGIVDFQGKSYIPVDLINRWYASLQSKMLMDPFFFHRPAN